MRLRPAIVQRRPRARKNSPGRIAECAGSRSRRRKEEAAQRRRASWMPGDGTPTTPTTAILATARTTGELSGELSGDG